MPEAKKKGLLARHEINVSKLEAEGLAGLHRLEYSRRNIELTSDIRAEVREDALELAIVLFFFFRRLCLIVSICRCFQNTNMEV